MKYLSVCSGIEAASVAWRPLGWEAVAFSEIEPFPCALLKHHYPNVPNWGDMTHFQEWPDASIDLLCGGTPCQSFSLAGLRKGLDDPRGNLMLTFGAIAARYRPRWLVWENVPGVLSSNQGRDFGAFLGLLAQLGYGFAYRILDAQYVRVQSHPRAVPQRRRRVFVVGHSGGQWQRAAAVLFERESLRGHPAPRRKAGQSVAVSPTLRSGGNRTGGNRPPGTDVDTCDSLIPEIVSQAMASKWANGTSGPAGDEHHNLLPVLAFPERMSATQCAASKNVTPALGALNPTALVTGFSVRRLTPLECERLMGFTNGYTAVPFRGKPASDAARYKALGNSWAINCARWLGERIQAVDDICPVPDRNSGH
ncbi:DNA cytosine methyltransferase [Vandammella animalimorsus]|uniref:DNA cytosine methyltransferase n=1 Tax=Vandammella animalimorsus TaxID=2029117 RepID=UPI0031BAB2B0